MAKSIEEYKEEIQDQPAVICVVCNAPITIGAAYAVHLQAIKGLHGMQLAQIRVSDIDAAHGGVCAACVRRMEKLGGRVFPLLQTIQMLAESRQHADERAARKAAEAAEAAKLAAEAALRKQAAAEKEVKIKSFFDFGDTPAADTQSASAPAANHNSAGSARRRLVQAGILKPANGKPRPEQAVVA